MSIFVILTCILSLFVVPNEATPGKIPINAIKKGAKVVVSIILFIHIQNQFIDF